MFYVDLSIVLNVLFKTMDPTLSSCVSMPFDVSKWVLRRPWGMPILMMHVQARTVLAQGFILFNAHKASSKGAKIKIN